MSLIPSYEKVVTGFTINSGGSNYTSPTIDIDGGGGIGATAEATIVGGKITAITITNQGSGYSTPPVVTVVGGGGTGADIDAIIGDLPYKNKLEFLIQEQLPEFVQNEYAGFVTFLEGYYRFLDQSGEVNNFLLNARDYSDIDTTLEVFIDQFRKQYAVDIPKNVLVNQRRLVKLISDFYESKGAENSIELLFKILYDETVEFFYPSTHILKASDGVWIEDVVIRILGADGLDPFTLSGKICNLVYYENTGVQIFPKTIKTTVTGVKKLAYTLPAIYELNVSLPKNSPLKVPGAGAVATVTITDGSVTSVDIVNGGSGYYAAPTVTLNGTDGLGVVLRANIVNGEIDTVTVVQGGSGYIEDAEDIQVIFSTDSIRTHIHLPPDPTTIYGYVIRQLSTVQVVSCGGEGENGDCGFRVGQIYQIDEQSIVGSYVIDPPMGSVSGGLISTIAANPADYGTYDAGEFNAGINEPFFDALGQYTLVGRDNRASVRISGIDAGGCVDSVTIFNTGFDFEQEEFQATITSPNGCEAVLAFTTGAILIKTGRFKDSRGMLSNINKLQDNYYYQNYSYVIKSGVTSGTWLPIINKTVHPAGMAVFGELNITQTIDMVDYIGVLEILVLNELFIDVVVLNDTTRSVHFYKVLTDAVTKSDVTTSHVYKVLSDTVTLSDATELLFDVGIYNPADDTTSTVDSFDRVVQYVRLFNEAFYTSETTVVDFGKTVVEDPVWVTRDFWAEIDYSGTEFAWNPEETIEVDFTKVLAEAANATESQAFLLSKPLTDTTTNSDTFAKTVEFYRTFTESVISNEYANAGIEKPQAEAVTSAETSTNHLYKYLTESITSTDTVGIIPYLVKTDNAGATELLIVANDAETIESIAAAEQSLITVLKGIFETVAVAEDGIINVQNYIEGELGSDYVGQSMTFAGTNSSFPVPNSIINLDAGNSLSYAGTGTTWFDMTANDLDASLTNMSYTDPYFTFNGTNATASIADNALLEPGTGDFTLEAWVYYSTIAGSQRTFISKTNNGGGASDWSYGLRTNSAGATYIEVGNGTTSITSPSYTVSTGQWYHIVGVWTNVASNSIALYINGVSEGSNSHSFTSVKNSTNPLYLGSYNGGEYPQWFDGRMSAVRYYNKALTAGEVTQNFNSLRGRFGI